MKKDGLISLLPRGKTKFLHIVKLSVFMMFLPLVMWANSGLAQQQISLKVKDASLESLAGDIAPQADYQKPRRRAY